MQPRSENTSIAKRRIPQTQLITHTCTDPQGSLSGSTSTNIIFLHSKIAGYVTQWYRMSVTH